MRIQFRRREIGECVSVIYRSDGVVLELPSYSRMFRVPHDLAHAVTERELRMAGGVYGLIASGHVFGNMSVVSGRPRHDAKARSERVMKAYGGSITTAELLAGTVHRAVESGQCDDLYQQLVRAWGSLETDPFPWTAQDVRTTRDTMREHDQRWQRVAVGDAMEFHWPEELVAPSHRPFGGSFGAGRRIRRLGSAHGHRSQPTLRRPARRRLPAAAQRLGPR